MAGSPAQAPSADEGAHLVLYDGVCGLCSRLLQFLLKHDRRAVFTFASLQSAAGRAMVERFGGDPNELSSFYVLANYRTNHRSDVQQEQRRVVRRRPAWVALEDGSPDRASCHPRSWIALYNVVARNRYRVFGRFEQCLTPRPEFRGRFVE